MSLDKMSTSKVSTKAPRKETTWTGQIAQLAAVVAVVFLAKGAIAEPFYVPSGSMEPTLLIGDALLASKFPYGYGTSSLPMQITLPETGRLFGETPKRGDVVVFRWPGDTSQAWVKRVVGLPGDRIQMRDGLLYINDTPVQRERLSDFVGEDPCGTADSIARVKRWKETLPNGVSYESLDCFDHGPYDNTDVYTVPPGNFFMMGDNRDNSTDSRVPTAVGYVPFENIIGRAQMIFFSIREGEHAWAFWRWPMSIRWERLFKIVR